MDGVGIAFGFLAVGTILFLYLRCPPGTTEGATCTYCGRVVWHRRRCARPWR